MLVSRSLPLRTPRTPHAQRLRHQSRVGRGPLRRLGVPARPHQHRGHSGGIRDPAGPGSEPGHHPRGGRGLGLGQLRQLHAGAAVLGVRRLGLGARPRRHQAHPAGNADADRKAAQRHHRRRHRLGAARHRRRRLHPGRHRLRHHRLAGPGRPRPRRRYPARGCIAPGRIGGGSRQGAGQLRRLPGGAGSRRHVVPVLPPRSGDHPGRKHPRTPPAKAAAARQLPPAR
jgi:hypothetical protein